MPSDVRDRSDLTGKVALVTGGSRNIGQATALALARAGASVGFVGRSSHEALGETLELLSAHGPAHGVLADVTVPAAVTASVDEIENALGGPVQIMVNNVGIRPRVPLREITVDDWDEVFAVNLRAAFLYIQRTLYPMMEHGWGRIINVSGLDAVSGSIDRVHVTTSKSGLIGLTASVALEAAMGGVTVNTVVPGTIRTERHTPGWYPAMDRFEEASKNRAPLMRLGEKEEVADLIAFLASDLASFITGQTMNVAGGYPLMRRTELEDDAKARLIGG
jgi:3-oxoacyl-[acyl-carrier protein] reductase